MANKGTTKYRSTKQERRVAKELGGRIVIASGALDDKGDVRSDKFLVECKTTSKDFYTFSVDTWNKLNDEAVKLGLIPLLQIDLCDTEMPVRKRFVIMNSFEWGWCFRPSDFQEEFLVREIRKSKKMRGEDLTHKGYFSKCISVSTLHCLPWAEFLSLLED